MARSDRPIFDRPGVLRLLESIAEAVKGASVTHNCPEPALYARRAYLMAVAAEVPATIIRHNSVTVGTGTIQFTT